MRVHKTTSGSSRSRAYVIWLKRIRGTPCVHLLFCDYIRSTEIVLTSHFEARAAFPWRINARNRLAEDHHVDDARFRLIATAAASAAAEIRDVRKNAHERTRGNNPPRSRVIFRVGCCAIHRGDPRVEISVLHQPRKFRPTRGGGGH